MTTWIYKNGVPIYNATLSVGSGGTEELTATDTVHVAVGGTYSFFAIACDTFGTCTSTETRNVTILDCGEDWNRYVSPANCIDGNGTQTVLYHDSNHCNTTYFLPIMNGSTVDCSMTCSETWVKYTTPAACPIDSTQLIYYIDRGHCGTYALLPDDNGTYINCSKSSGASVLPDLIIPNTPVTPPLTVIPNNPIITVPGNTILPSAESFKGMYESINVLLEKIFTGETVTKIDTTSVGSYWLELLITGVALTLLILAGISITKKKHKRGKK